MFGTSPGDGLWPNTPQKKAGTRIEPPMSEPTPNGEAPDPTAAPSPPEDPPAVRSGSYGLFVQPYTWLVDSIHSDSSEVLVTPSGIAPASISRCTGGAVSTARKSRRITRPVDCGMPCSAIDSLTVNGTPSSGGSASPAPAAAIRESAAAASSRACSKRSAASALMRGARS